MAFPRLSPRLILPLLVAIGISPLASAQNQVFRCEDADGRITYTNDRTAAKGCKTVESDITVIPSSPPRATTTPTPSNFPSVTSNTQHDRDNVRRKLLESELAAEESALAEANKALAEQEAIRNGDEQNYQKVLDRLQPFKEKVEQHARNIEALNKEISSLR